MIQDVVIGATFLILGLVLGHILAIFSKRPKLLIAGSSGGGGTGPGHSKFSVFISNRPGLIGIRIKETTLFGRHVHSHMEKGLTVEREVAKKCTAVLYDDSTGELVCQLWWRLPDGTISQQATIESGERVELILLAKLQGESSYFPYEPTSDTDPTLKVPPRLKIAQAKKFNVVVHYCYGRKQLRFSCEIKKTIDGRLHYVIDGQGGATF